MYAGHPHHPIHAVKKAVAKHASAHPAAKAAPAHNTTIWGWLAAHPIAIPIGIIALLIGISYGWRELTKKQNQRGIAVRPLRLIIRDVLRFTFKEDIAPLHPKAPHWATWKRLYLTLTALTILGSLIGDWPIPLLLLLGTISYRYGRIAKQRRVIIKQMFDVALGECRYPKGSELQPWGYIQVQSWTNLIQPGVTAVVYPAAYQSEDQKAREKFERQFNGTVSEDNAWTYKWESAKNRVVCQPAAHLPSNAPYPGPGPKWDEIPVGIAPDGTIIHIPLSITPHCLVCGPTGSGKSVLQRSILNHVLAHEETWRIVAIDMKRVEMTWLRKYPQVLKVAVDLEEAVSVLRSLREEMMRRYEEMEEEGVNHAQDLASPPPAILCMIDESTVLLAAEGIKSDEGRERDALHAEAGMIIGELGRLSRASMIHVIACFQRPDAKFLSGEIKANFDSRIAAGRMDTTPSMMVLDSEAANRLPKIKGRGMIRIGGELTTFQGFFAQPSWFDEWKASQDGASPSEPAGENATQSDVISNANSKGFRGLAARVTRAAEARAAALEATEAVHVAASEAPEVQLEVADDGPASTPEPATEVAPQTPTIPEPVEAGPKVLPSKPTSPTSFAFDDYFGDEQEKDEGPEPPSTTLPLSRPPAA